MADVDCHSCHFFNDLYATKTKFVADIFHTVGPSLTNVLTLALTTWIVIQGFGSIMQPSSVAQRLQNIVKTGLMAAIVMLALRTPSGTPLVNDWILDPLEDMGLRYGISILQGRTHYEFPADATNAYSQFASVVERQVLRITRVPALLLEMTSYWPGELVLTLVVCLLLFLPYAFIFGLVGAFMLEAMFKYVAIGIVAPLLAPFALFQATRPFTVAGMRIVVGAFFTMLFTGGALGFTMATVDHYADKIYAAACKRVDNDSDAKKTLQCQQPESAGSVGLPEGGIVDAGPPSTGKISLIDGNIVMMFVLGFASILLHLQAKALASNISGANDGAGPAAATLAAMKGIAGAGAYYAMRGAFGAGGAGQSMSDILRGQALSGITGQGLTAIGQAMHQHGVVGGSVAALYHQFKFGADGERGARAGGGDSAGRPSWSSPGDWRSANIGAQRYSGGGHGTGQTPGQSAGLRNRNG